MATLTAADYAVIGALILISSGIGVYYWLIGGRQKSTEEYFMANKSMRMIPVAIGLMVSYLSAVSLLGVSSENYVYGTQYAVINISYGLATPFAAYFYLPVFFKLGTASTFEYLQKRFGTTTRLIASFAFLLQLLLYSGVVLYAPALALEATTGLSTTASVIGLGLICTFYSTIGGIKAVLITDVFQGLLMLTAVVTVIATAAVATGGLNRIWQIAGEGSRLEFNNISPDPTVRYTWWSLILGGFFTYLSLYSVNQVQVQRMLTISNLATAQRALWWSWPMASIMSLTLCFSGLAIYAKYHNCDPLVEGRINSNDQLMPLYVMDMLSDYPGVPGLFIAGIFSAGLSTISATINSLSAVILEDYIKPLWRIRNKDLSATTSIIISKILALVIGLSCVAVGFLAQYLGGLLQLYATIGSARRGRDITVEFVHVRHVERRQEAALLLQCDDGPTSSLSAPLTDRDALAECRQIPVNIRRSTMEFTSLLKSMLSACQCYAHGTTISQLERDIGSDQFPPNEHYFGLVNFGNTCYSNSVLQALYFCRPFREKVLEYKARNKRTKETLLTCLADLFYSIATQKKKVGSIAPKKFIARLRKEKEEFDNYMQQDAHEFLNFLINHINEIILGEHTSAERTQSKPTGGKCGAGDAAGSPPEPTWVHEIFQGILTSETRCLNCETVSSKDEDFFDLQVDVDQNTSITHCLRCFSNTETLCSDNKFKCDHCSSYQEAQKRMRVKKLPMILALHLKRFKYVEQYNRHIKVSHRVVFPLELRLFNTSDDAVNPDRLYDLVAVVIHCGSGPNRGHYISIVKSHGFWLLFDDDMVDKIDASTIEDFYGLTSDIQKSSETGYILFYQSRDCS
ncbi:Ubiquitin carboxyl-terminal hydrolase 46 [Atta colombica]|uniref:ubiquitinyl hydrolase 1 n=1 Tax=Atta colombica TaxID=520822 RepID=A0A151HZ26_9HYME|nr:Ubiquitin carboxyl-terminal hydrolase 46 [Atta colombica]